MSISRNQHELAKEGIALDRTMTDDSKEDSIVPNSIILYLWVVWTLWKKVP